MLTYSYYCYSLSIDSQLTNFNWWSRFLNEFGLRDSFLLHSEGGGWSQSPRGGWASASGEGEALPERGAGATGEEEGEGWEERTAGSHVLNAAVNLLMSPQRLEEIMKRTRKSDAGEKVSVIHCEQPCWNLTYLGEIIKICFVYNHRRMWKPRHRSTVRLTTVTQSPFYLWWSFDVFHFSAAAGNPQTPGAAVLGSPQGVSSTVVNGVQLSAHQNGVSANREAADFEKIIQLNKSNPGQQQSGLVSEPILAFDGGEPFLMKTGPMKPQHVAGTEPTPNGLWCCSRVSGWEQIRQFIYTVY